MALTGSGQISLGDIAGEFGGDAPHALSEYYDKGNAPSSGEIQLAADFYGTSDALTVSGGTRTTVGSYSVRTFTSSGTFGVSGGSISVEVLVVGGGGSGGGDVGGGGGAGGMITGTISTSVSANCTVTVGAGGAQAHDADGNDGADSYFAEGGDADFECLGAGGGGGGLR